ncbi:MAG: hypothetical protein Q4B99_00400 [Clostridia bacterium]|nr:hypothetical protein [Clostridia bacterium]
MYEHDQGEKRNSSIVDIILVIGLLILIMFAGQLVSALSNAIGDVWARVALIAVVIIAAGLVYLYRLDRYRYMFYHQDGGQIYDERFGEMVDVVYDEPYGTFIVKRGVADKGKEKLRIALDEMVALAPPEGKAEYCALPTMRCTKGFAKSAHLLVYERDGERRAVLFHPDGILAGHIEAKLRERAQAPE